MFYDIVVKIAYFIFSIFFKLDVIGEDNILEEGSLVLCANHKNILDPILVSILFPRRIHWMAKKELFKNPILRFLIKSLGAFPVDREKMDISAVKKSLKTLTRGEVLGIFPEGTRVKEMNLDNAKSGASLLAVRSKSPVLPVYIESSYKLFKKVNIYIGEPMYLYKDLKGKPTPNEYSEMSKKILAEIYSLNKKGDGIN